MPLDPRLTHSECRVSLQELCMGDYKCLAAIMGSGCHSLLESSSSYPDQSLYLQGTVVRLATP